MILISGALLLAVYLPLSTSKRGLSSGTSSSRTTPSASSCSRSPRDAYSSSLLRSAGSLRLVSQKYWFSLSGSQCRYYAFWCLSDVVYTACSSFSIRSIACYLCITSEGNSLCNINLLATSTNYRCPRVSCSGLGQILPHEVTPRVREPRELHQG